MSTCTCGHSPLLTTQQTADYLGVSANALGHWRSSGTGPRFVRIGAAVRYRIVDVDAYITDNLVDPAA